MVREERYLVLRYSDIDAYLDEHCRQDLMWCTNVIAEGRKADGKNPYPKFVCVKDTYPEYEYVWEQIEKRVDAGIK